MKNRKAVFLHSSDMEKFTYPPECPFDVSRAGKVREIVDSMGLLKGSGRSEVAPKPAERVTLKKFHSAQYLHVLKTAAQGHWEAEALNMGIGTLDCPVFEDMYDYSVMACGATVMGAEMILAGSADVAFNPSGGLHHAGPNRASGFCYLNDVAVGCAVLAEAGKRVLYLDLDVHFGDGVAYAFYDRSDVMTISFHENPGTLFPGTGFVDEIGTGQGKGYCVNVPLPVGTYDEAYSKAFQSLAIPLITAFNPDVIVLQLGADALAGDPLAHLQLTNNAYFEIIKSLLGFDKPILATGGGGYNIDNTARAWALDWAVLCGGYDEHDTGPGLGGVILESTERQQKLRDRQLTVTSQQQKSVEPAAEAVIKAVKQSVFGFHSL